MNKFIIVFLLALILNLLQANNEIFISPKIALKMIDKKEITFISLDNNNLKIKKSKKLDIKFLKSSDILGHTECEPFYACAKRLKKYFSNLNISNNVSPKLNTSNKIKEKRNYSVPPTTNKGNSPLNKSSKATEEETSCLRQVDR